MTAANAQQFTPRLLLSASIGVAVITIALKLLAWRLTDSVGLLSDALESLVNLASAVFALTMVTIAARPADDGHPYGHHKAEYFSSGFEGLMIVGAAVAIVVAAGERLLSPQPLQAVGPGLALAVGSSALNGVLAWVMFRAARGYRARGSGGAIAVEADARHLMTDIWTTAGVVAGVALVAWTGWLWLDPVIAIAVALNILREGYGLVWRASQGLMDPALEPEVMATIEGVLKGFERRGGEAAVVRFDHIASRQAGNRRFIDLHLHLPAGWSLGRAAALRGEVEQALLDAVPGLRASIQLLPSGVEVRATAGDEEPG